MLVKTVEYEDFNGDKRTDTLYFNLSEPEIARLEVKYPGGLEKYVENMNAEERPEEVMDLFETIIIMAYGKKSEDGRYFHKPQEETNKFKESAAYNKIFVELMTDADKAAAFFNALVFIQKKEES